MKMIIQFLLIFIGILILSFAVPLDRAPDSSWIGFLGVILGTFLILLATIVPIEFEKND